MTREEKLKQTESLYNRLMEKVQQLCIEADQELAQINKK